MLLAEVMRVSRASLIAHPERTLEAVDVRLVRSLFSRRAAGEPIAYLLGTREFYGRNFRVSPATLIPRPETELIVEQALARLPGRKCPETRANAGLSQMPASGRPRVLDLGTGSGAIAVTLALERPGLTILAADISIDALGIARENALNLGADVEFIQSDWYEGLGGRRFDLIVSNPPYVAGNDFHLSQGDLRFEPQVALTDKSVDGLSSIRRIVEGARDHMDAGGWLLFEHGHDQASACRELILKSGFANPISICDLSGIPRVAGGQIR